MLAELAFELWIGDPAEIKGKRVKKQKYDREDARLLLRLLRENNFPKIWVPSPQNGLDTVGNEVSKGTFLKSFDTDSADSLTCL